MGSRDPFDIQGLSDVFEALRRGRHICAEDGDLYWTLKENFPVLERLFSALGFSLERHPRDFFYFHGSGSLSDRSERMAVFMFILVEWLSDRGEPVEESIITRRFNISQLPHFKIERYTRYMSEAGISGGNGLTDVIRNFERFGFARRDSEDSFSFRPPVFRFVDLCHSILEDDESGDDAGLDVPASGGATSYGTGVEERDR